MADDPIDLGDDGAGAPNLDSFAKAIAGAFSKVSDFTILKTVPLQLVAQTIGLVLTIPVKLITDVAVLVAQTMVAAMEGDNADLAQLEQTVLSEIFGTELGSARGGNGAATADSIGALVISQLLDAGAASAGGLGEVTPSAAPAQAFLGKMLGVAVRGWGIDVVADLGSLHHITAFNDLVEAVIGSMGIGRLSRTALGPAIHSAIALPLQWLVHTQLRPTLLGPGTAVKQYLRGQWDFGTLENELGPQGYSSDRIEALVNDAESRLGPSDVLVLVRNQVWDLATGQQYLKDSGYPEDVAASLIQLDTLKQLDALRPRAIAAYEQQYKRGELSDSGFRTALGLLDITPEVSQAWLTILRIEQAAGFKVLDKGQLDAALAKNVISPPEWRAGLELLGYSADQVTILELTEQAALADKEQAAKAKADKAAQIAADKAAAALRKKADQAAAAAKRVADHQAAAEAKVAAAAVRTQTLIEKQALLAKQAQERRDQIAATLAQKTIDGAQAAKALADVQAVETRAAASVDANNRIQAALATAATQTDQAQLTATTAAAQAETDAQAAIALADNQRAQLEERRQERLAALAADLATVDQEEAAGLLTANQATKKRDAINNANTAAVAQERLDQLAIARAEKAAQKAQTTAATKAAKAAAAVGLIPTATARQTATIAATAVASAAARAQAGTATAAQKVTIAQQQAAAATKAAADLDTLNAQLLREFQEWEAAHPGA